MVGASDRSVSKTTYCVNFHVGVGDSSAVTIFCCIAQQPFRIRQRVPFCAVVFLLLARRFDRIGTLLSLHQPEQLDASELRSVTSQLWLLSRK